MDKRRSPRFVTRFDALVSAEQEEGAGVLGEISYAGARLEGTSMRPPLGTKVTLYIFIQPVSPFELSGSVIRHTETGFAVTYELFDSETRQLVDDVAALVSSPLPK
ncbi:MAG: PilZ domain-containing protein [Deltaproteobacteria bacterium]|nr:PilZ domain-containing protein [Deltaproteobacteria bacterium]